MKTFLLNFLKSKKYLIGFLIFEFLIITVFTYPYILKKQSYSIELEDKLETVVYAVVNIYGIVSETIYQEVVNKPEIINLFKQAYTADEERQAEIRQAMQVKLQSTYDNLRQKNLRQLHFHLPDGTSFLRMHKPQKFGDKLFDVRYSVRQANVLKQPVQGFEEGRVFNGFRYVFPLFDGKTHIGSVETSVSFEAIHEEIAKLYPLKYQMILKKNIVASKVFSSEKSNYIPCPLSSDYMCENEQLRKIETCHFCRTRMLEIDKKLYNQLNEQLAQNKPFIAQTKLKGVNYVLNFHPVKNLQAQTVAYIVGYTEDNYFVELKYGLYLELFVFSSLNLITCLFIFYIQSSKEVIQQKNQALMQLNQDKNEFLGIAAHDLKNPLSAIQGLAEEIEDSYDELSKEDIVEFAGLINNSAHRMFALITNLLDVSAIESGKFNLHLENVDVLPVVQRVIETYHVQAKAKQIKINLDFTQQTYIAHSDYNMVYQILDNLVSNAIKYSPWQKAIYVSIQVKEEFIDCSIRDEGPGLSQDDQKKLFGKFTRLSSKPTNGEHSTGLGLFIVKRLADATRAKVWCESELGRGATFTVSFPQI